MSVVFPFYRYLLLNNQTNQFYLCLLSFSNKYLTEQYRRLTLKEKFVCCPYLFKMSI